MKPDDALVALETPAVDLSAYVLKEEVAALMLSHFPVRKPTVFGLIGEYCLCDVHLGVDFTYAAHVIALLEGETDAADPVVN